MGVFHVFWLYKWYQIAQNITYAIYCFFLSSWHEKILNLI